MARGSVLRTTLVLAGFLAAPGCGTLLDREAPEVGICLMTWRAHDGWVSSVAFSPDGKRIASGGDDRALKVWDAESGKELWARRADGDGVTVVAFSPDGRRLVSGSWGGVLRAWDAPSGKELTARRAHAEKITSIAFSPDGTLVASGSEDDSLKVWEAGGLEEVMTLDQGNEYDVTTVAWSPDGRRIVSGDGENMLRVWDSHSGEQLMTFPGHDETVTGVAWSPDGTRLVSGSWDDTVRVWDPRSGRELKRLRGHAGDVTRVAWSPDGRRIASASEDDTVKVWDAERARELAALRGHADDVTCVAFSSDGRLIVSGSRATLKVWKAPAGIEPISGVHRAEEVASSPVLTASGMAWWGSRLIIADRVPRQLRAYAPPDRFEVFKALTHPVGVAVDPDGHLLVTEKEKDVLYRLARFRKDGGEETLVESKVDVKQAPAGVGTPHFLAVHPNGTIYWSGFPDGGTRSLRPGSKEVVVAEPRIVHTYGIGLSPKHDWLYVNSKIPNPDRRGTWRFPVDREGRLGKGEFFIQVDQFTTTHLADLPPAQDGSASLTGWLGRLQGLAVDKLGYIYVGGAESHSSGSAVAVFTPDGKKLAAMIVGVPRNISGLAFGGLDGRTLFVTGAGEYKLFQARLPVPGEVLRD